MKILPILILSASLACADLSPEEFNDLRNVALHYCGLHFAGTSHIGTTSFYRFNNAKDEPAAFVQMGVANFEEAKAAMIASMGTLIMCQYHWKRPLEDLRSRIIPPPPEGYTLDDPSQIVGFLMK